MPNNALRIYKGINPNIDSYSAFFDNKKLSFTEMEQLLKEREVTDCYCCGIATDFCVGKITVIFRQHISVSTSRNSVETFNVL